MDINEKLEKVKSILRKDMVKFGKEISPNKFYLPTPLVHRGIIKLLLDQKIKLLNIIAPRGIAKTALVTIYILHHLFLSEDPGGKVVVIISKTQALAKAILQTIADIINFSAGFRRLFGYHGEQVAKTWREDMLVLDTGDAIIARGTGQPVRGVNVGMQRPTLIVIDDPEDENNTKTIEAMEHNLRWVLSNVLPSGDAHRLRVIVVGTPLHEKCIVSSLAEMKKWKTIHLGNDREKGIALWPESKSIEWLNAEFENLDSVGKAALYYQEYECNLVPGKNAMFPKDNLNFYEKETDIVFISDEPFLKFVNGILLPVNIYMGVDPASSLSQSAFYSTIVPVAVASDMRVYVLDYYRKRVKPSAHADAIEAFYLRLRPRRTLIETIGYQESLRDVLKNRIFIPGLELKENPRDSKGTRYLEMLEPIVSQKKLFIKGGLVEGIYKGPMHELYDELTLFPKAKTKDLLDGLYYACKRMRPPSHSVAEKKIEIPEYEQVLIDYYHKEEEEESALPTYFDPFQE